MTEFFFGDKGSLTHYGVLGMKWGVRKDNRGSRSERKAAKQESRADRKARKEKRSQIMNALNNVEVDAIKYANSKAKIKKEWEDLENLNEARAWIKERVTLANQYVKNVNLPEGFSLKFDVENVAWDDGALGADLFWNGQRVSYWGPLDHDMYKPRLTDHILNSSSFQPSSNASNT